MNKSREDYVMKNIGLAGCGIAAAFVLGASAPAHAQGENPAGVNPEHYLCYRVTGQARTISVKLIDQFQSTEVARVMRPVFLCNPVQKNTQEIKDEKTHLVCYLVTGVKPANKPVRVDNQFGKQVLRVAAAQVLCVPSLKEVPK
jgi:hypothetical protein